MSHFRPRSVVRNRLYSAKVKPVRARGREVGPGEVEDDGFDDNGLWHHGQRLNREVGRERGVVRLGVEPDLPGLGRQREGLLDGRIAGWVDCCGATPTQ